MLIAKYDQDDAIEEDYGYNDLIDALNHQSFKDIIWNEIKNNILFPISLRAKPGRWDGSTGYSTADSLDEAIEKIFGFEITWLEFHKENDQYFFKSASHDMPTGFTVYMEGDNYGT